MSVMQLGHLLTLSGLTYLEVSSEVCHDSFCQLGSSVSLSWVVCREAFYSHVVSSFSCIPVICPKLVLILTPFQFVHLFCNLSQVYPAVLVMYLLSAAVLSHVSRNFFKGLPRFLLPVGEQCFIILGSLSRGILFTCCIQFHLYINLS